MKTITMKDWKKAGSFETLFKGVKLPIQVTEEIYDKMLGVLPPQEFGKTRASFIDYQLPVQQYFLVGEPTAHVNGKPAYATFVKAYDTKFFFIGWTHEDKNVKPFYLI